MEQPRDNHGRFAGTSEPRFGDPQTEAARQSLRKRYGSNELDLFMLRSRFNATRLLKYSPQQPRDNHGRWTAGVASTAVSRIDTHGGFTINPTTHAEPTEGYAVSKWPEKSLIFKRAGMHPARVARNIRRWLIQNKAMMDEPMVHIGGWYDQESGNVYLDFSVVHPKNAKAAAIADAKRHNQKAIYSLHEQEEINTGGMGEAVSKAAGGVDRFFLPVQGKSVDELVDDIMDALGFGDDSSDDNDGDEG